jgi:hypothetical protein
VDPVDVLVQPLDLTIQPSRLNLYGASDFGQIGPEW